MPMTRSVRDLHAHHQPITHRDNRRHQPRVRGGQPVEGADALDIRKYSSSGALSASTNTAS
jgi:hypothetical protein